MPAAAERPVIMIVLQEACLFDYRPRAALLWVVAMATRGVMDARRSYV
jgi:hypothetical protein